MYIDYLYSFILFKVFTEAGDKNIEAAPKEIVVLAPKSFQDFGAFDDLIGLL